MAADKVAAVLQFFATRNNSALVELEQGPDRALFGQTASFGETLQNMGANSPSYVVRAYPVHSRQVFSPPEARAMRNTPGVFLDLASPFDDAAALEVSAASLQEMEANMLAKIVKRVPELVQLLNAGGYQEARTFASAIGSLSQYAVYALLQNVVTPGFVRPFDVLENEWIKELVGRAGSIPTVRFLARNLYAGMLDLYAKQTLRYAQLETEGFITGSQPGKFVFPWLACTKAMYVSNQFVVPQSAKDRAEQKPYALPTQFKSVGVHPDVIIIAGKEVHVQELKTQITETLDAASSPKMHSQSKALTWRRQAHVQALAVWCRMAVLQPSPTVFADLVAVQHQRAGWSARVLIESLKMDRALARSVMVQYLLDMTVRTLRQTKNAQSALCGLNGVTMLWGLHDSNGHVPASYRAITPDASPFLYNWGSTNYSLFAGSDFALTVVSLHLDRALIQTPLVKFMVQPSGPNTMSPQEASTAWSTLLLLVLD